MSARIRSARRARSAGAAMAEAVVVIPTFIILFACSIFLWQLYLQKERVMADSRFRLWTYAISTNCGDPGTPGIDDTAPSADVTGISNGSMDNGGNAGADTSSGQNAVQNTGTSTLSKSLGTASIQESKSVTAAGVIGGFSSNVGAARKMMCNEPPHNGDLFGLAKAAVHIAAAVW
jgi:hypothetical protein